MIINYGNKEIIIKIVYWGGAMSGKTTSLKYIFRHFGNNLKSIETSTGRTLFFDFGELLIQKGQWRFHLHIFSLQMTCLPPSGRKHSFFSGRLSALQGTSC